MSEVNKEIERIKSITLDLSINDVYSITSFLTKSKLIHSLVISYKNINKAEVLHDLTANIFLSELKDYIVFGPIKIYELKPNKDVLINQFSFSINEELFKKITAIKKGTLHIELINSSNQILSYLNKEISLFPYYYFDSNHFSLETLASFSSPNSLYVKRNILKIRDILNSKYDYKNTFAYIGYEVEDIKKEIEVVYNLFLNKNLFLINLPRQYLINGLNIRSFKDIEESKRATPLDLALYFSSCLEYIGFNTLLVFIDNEVKLGVWLNNQTFSSIVIEDTALFNSYLNLNRLLIIDLSLLMKKVSFIENTYVSKDNLIKTKNDFIVLDINVARKNDILPLPFYKDNENVVDEEAKKLEDYHITTHLAQNEIYPTESRFKYYERKLLDYSKSNKFISMNLGVSNIELIVPSIQELNYILSSKENRIVLDYLKEKDSLNISKRSIFDINSNNNIKKRCKSNLVKGIIELFLNEKDYYTTLSSLWKKAKFDMDESGTNTLFITLGIFTWKENIRSKSVYHAPIILYPVSLIKRSDKKYELEICDQDPIINFTFLSFIKEQFNAEIDLEDELPYSKENEEIIDIGKILNKLKLATASIPGLKIENYAYLGRFSFNKVLLWNDIRNRRDELLSHRIIKSFVNGRMSFTTNKPSLKAKEIDEYVSLNDVAIPLSYDSTQLEAIISATNGESFVLIGPPGTGKSQTIANIIVNSLYNGKKVLFCSEKRAALDIVYSRLKEIGIDPFILELHSNKAEKKLILEHLYKTLELGEVAPIKDFNLVIENLSINKETLKNITKKIHHKGKYSISLYEAILEYEKVADRFLEVNITIDSSFIINFSNSKKEEALNTLKSAHRHSTYLNTLTHNVFKIYKNKDYSENIKNEIHSKISNLLLKISDFNKINGILSNELGIENIDYESIKKLFTIFDYIYTEETYLSLLTKEDYKNLIKKILSMLKNERSFYETYEKLDYYFYSQIFNSLSLSDIDELILNASKYKSSNLIQKLLIKNKINKTLKKYIKNKKTFFKEDLSLIFNDVKFIISSKSIIKKNSILLISILSDTGEYFLNNTNNDYYEIISKLLNTLELGKKIENISYGKIKNEKLALHIYKLCNQSINVKSIKEYLDNYVKIRDECNELEQKYKFDFSILDTNNFYSSLYDNLKEINDNIEYLFDYSSLLLMEDKLVSLNLSSLVNLYKNTKYNYEEISVIFIRNLYKSIVKYLISINHLDKFLGDDMNDIISNYNKLNNEYSKMVVNEVAVRLSKNNPNTSFSSINSSEVGILKKTIKSLGRGVSLRKILSLIPSIIQKLSPCFLVSPLSCAKYLNPNLYHFDIVIFDEASQLTTQEAIGVISRGDSLIIAGDDKQLPPTSFFNKIVKENEDNSYIGDVESILDDGIACSFPIKKLLYHYRSKSESLIAFSNNKFYDNELYTFPSLNELSSEINYHYVENGIYDAGRSATNKIEANKLVDDLVFDIKQNNGSKTYGIITFSIHQMDLIYKILQERIEKDKDLENIISKELKEDIFVKNLENVQGDERDIIYLSICYSKNKNGRFIQNFGPINNLGGERRLNVAITRSKERMHVYSSIDYIDINLNKTNSKGVEYLRSFLEYAKLGGTHGLDYISSNQNNLNLINGIEVYLKEDLKKAGYKSNTHIGLSKFKVDIGVLNPLNDNEYLLGILTDSNQYYETPTINDKNIIQINELKKLGWNIEFIWSLDYFNNKEKVISNIINKLKELEEEYKSGELINKNNEITINQKYKFKKAVKKTNSYLKPYSFFTLKNFYNEKQLLDLRNREFIYRLIKNIISVEWPISKSFLIKRIYELFQIKRKNKDNTAMINYFLHKLNNPTNYSYDVDNIFYFKDGCLDLSSSVNFYRRSSGREIEEISKEEIATLILEVIEKEISIDVKSLKRTITSSLGFKSKTKRIDDVLDFVITYLKNDLHLIDYKENGYIYLINFERKEKRE